jgi:hypothetical protein
MTEVRITGDVTATVASVVAVPVVVVEGSVRGATSVGAKVSYALFGKGGILNSNRYLRIGFSTKFGQKVFRVAGDWLKLIRTNHIDIGKFGPM